MEIHHKIRPPHGWREFIFEIGTIVLGVLLALGAEQAVEAMHRAHQVQEAENAMRLELGEDDGPQAYVRAAASDCLKSQLRVMHDALEAGTDQKSFHTLAIAYHPPLRTWDEEAWQSTVASNVGAYMGAKRLIQWSLPYRLIPAMAEQAASERGDLVALRSSRNSTAKLTDAETDRLIQIVDRLAVNNLALTIQSLGVLDSLGKLGAGLSPETQKTLLAEARMRFGACVQPPDVKVWRDIGQATSPSKTVTAY